MIYDSIHDNCMRSPDGQATEFVQLCISAVCANTAHDYTANS